GSVTYVGGFLGLARRRWAFPAARGTRVDLARSAQELLHQRFPDQFGGPLARPTASVVEDPRSVGGGDPLERRLQGGRRLPLGAHRRDLRPPPPLCLGAGSPAACSRRSRRSRRDRFSSSSSRELELSDESPSHQLIPISRARSTDATSSRSLIVSNSMS